MRNLRTPLARARGLGSAKEGVGHWWTLRVSAVALIPLTVWFVASLVALAGADHAAVTAWLGHPVAAVLMVLLIAATFYHGALGMTEIYLDYIHSGWLRLAVDLATKALCLVLAVAAILAVLRIAFGGPA